jgi:glycosyltransferase involved in cell wall biosynthesis
MFNIAIIGPGHLSIPAKGWGGTEALVWNHIKELRSRGIVVDIFNTKDLDSVAADINARDYDFIHLHYDAYCQFFNERLNKPFCCTSHWGEVKEMNWQPWWWNIFNSMKSCSGLICLSSEIEKIYKENGCNNFTRVLPVGTTVNNFKFKSLIQNKKAVCVGKIESRKMQAELANIGSNKIDIDFYGPLSDNRFNSNSTCIHKGIAERDWLYDNLTDYSSFVLLSKGEAAAQVIPEALAAGLSICVTETSAANLDRSLPFIKVIPNNWYECDHNLIINDINELNVNNYKYRKDIRKYAEDNFDTKVIINKYIDIMKDFNNENSISNNSNK